MTNGPTVEREETTTKMDRVENKVMVRIMERGYNAENVRDMVIYKSDAQITFVSNPRLTTQLTQMRILTLMNKRMEKSTTLLPSRFRLIKSLLSHQLSQHRSMSVTMIMMMRMTMKSLHWMR